MNNLQQGVGIFQVELNSESLRMHPAEQSQNPDSEGSHSHDIVFRWGNTTLT